MAYYDDESAGLYYDDDDDDYVSRVGSDEWLIYNVVTKRIVNCMTTHLGRQEAKDRLAASGFDMQNIELKRHWELSQDILEAYEFWNKRP